MYHIFTDACLIHYFLFELYSKCARMKGMCVLLQFTYSIVILLKLTVAFSWKYIHMLNFQHTKDVFQTQYCQRIQSKVNWGSSQRTWVKSSFTGWPQVSHLLASLSSKLEQEDLANNFLKNIFYKAIHKCKQKGLQDQFKDLQIYSVVTHLGLSRKFRAEFFAALGIKVIQKSQNQKYI